MNSQDVQNTIMQYIREHSGFETHRSYLGMSHLFTCARKQYFDFVNGTTADDRCHLGSFSGYTFENIMLDMLRKTGVANLVQRELVSQDPLLRGHIDAETVGGDLLEIKSVNGRKYDLIALRTNPLIEHVAQVQTYMYFGGYHQAWIVYVCRDSFETKVFGVPPSINPNGVEARAKYLLSAIHEHMPPVCECSNQMHSRILVTPFFAESAAPVHEEEK
jgi:hypothetical protein